MKKTTGILLSIAVLAMLFLKTSGKISHAAKRKLYTKK